MVIIGVFLDTKLIESVDLYLADGFEVSGSLADGGKKTAQ